MFVLKVMENDTLSSIAVKFETTPAELARLNKKPLGATSAIFSGEVMCDVSSLLTVGIHVVSGVVHP